MSRKGKLVVFKTPAKVSMVRTSLVIQPAKHRAITFKDVKNFELEDGYFLCELEDGRKICTNGQMVMIEGRERAKVKKAG